MRVKKEPSINKRYPTSGTLVQKLCVIPEIAKQPKSEKEVPPVRFDERLQEIERKKLEQQRREESALKSPLASRHDHAGEDENYILCKNTPEKNEVYELGALSMLYSKKSLFS